MEHAETGWEGVMSLEKTLNARDTLAFLKMKPKRRE